MFLFFSTMQAAEGKQKLKKLVSTASGRLVKPRRLIGATSSEEEVVSIKLKAPTKIPTDAFASLRKYIPPSALQSAKSILRKRTANEADKYTHVKTFLTNSVNEAPR